VQGVDFTRFQQTTNAIEVKTSFVSEFRRDQQLKAGAEFQWPRVQFGAPGELAFVSDSTGQHLARFVDQPPRFPGVQLYVPYIAAGFAQEEGEWNDMRIRAGVRFDYFNARPSLPSDLANPANSIDGAP